MHIKEVHKGIPSISQEMGVILEGSIKEKSKYDMMNLTSQRKLRSKKIEASANSLTIN